MKLLKPTLKNVAVLLVFIAVSNAQQAIAKPTEGEIAKSLQAVTATINKTLPKMIDSDTRLENVSGINNAFNYRYTLIHHAVSEINVEDFKTNMRPKLLNNLCTNSNTKFARTYDIPMVYNYFGMNGNKITSIQVVASECEKPKVDYTGITKGLLSAGIGGFGSALIFIIGIGLIYGIRKLYFRIFRKFDKIIKEGKLAFSNDLKIEDNPYGSDEYKRRDAWDKGWKQGEKARRKIKR
ncbi:hypothetical protein [Mariprofundus ferrooxydans]|uniref:hypothetical protein n=1 Tax=Mariprofundus ferrooxydans TaxID=314344 RepID=UPI00142FB295|nr:hypothetical protein [Mariprofundus ferrooxydans]